jgi:hypothetical protein
MEHVKHEDSKPEPISIARRRELRGDDAKSMTDQAIEDIRRHAEKLREELTLARIDRHSGQLDELDVEGILAFAERVLPRAADLWVQASGSGSNNCSFQTESRSTETALLEPA